MKKEIFLDYAYVKHDGKYVKIFEDNPWIDDILVIMRGINPDTVQIRKWCDENCVDEWMMLKDDGYRSFWAFKDSNDRTAFEGRWHTKERDWLEARREEFPHCVMFIDPSFNEQEVSSWLQENCQGIYYVFGEALMSSWHFTHEQDAILFKLTWGGNERR